MSKDFINSLIKDVLVLFQCLTAIHKTIYLYGHHVVGAIKKEIILVRNMSYLLQLNASIKFLSLEENIRTNMYTLFLLCIYVF